ncbi:Conserved_hypothetical protein [Hexamita inflata]|uniref:Uncharacterized protein n=2 Tax=Hexamita inflata TaxID=28002 RepID=A0AA86Q943_9EUKA|nr:Conserved hypothetical protein [Hexamita inflata]
MKTLEHLRHCFDHNGPVLTAAFIDVQKEQYFSLTENRIYYWYRDCKQNECPFEAPFANATEPSPTGAKFVDMVHIDHHAVVADSCGVLHIYKVDNLNVLTKEEFTIVSMKDKCIIDIAYCNKNLYVLHEGGFLQRYPNFGIPVDDLPNSPLNFRVFSQQRNIELKIQKESRKLQPYHYKDGQPDLLFVAESKTVRVYAAYPIVGTKCTMEVVSKCGFLSEILSQKDISAIDTEIMLADDGLLLLGNKNGNLSCWEIAMADDNSENAQHKFKLQFKPIFSTWQHGMKITAVDMCTKSLISFSFDKDGCCVAMDLKSNRVVNKFIPHAKAVTSVQLDAKSGIMLTASKDYTAKVWRVWIE